MVQDANGLFEAGSGEHGECCDGMDCEVDTDLNPNYNHASVAGKCADGKLEKVTICHATGSNGNPWVRISIAKEGWINGHDPDSHQGGRDYMIYDWGGKIPEEGGWKDTYERACPTPQQRNGKCCNVNGKTTFPDGTEINDCCGDDPTPSPTPVPEDVVVDSTPSPVTPAPVTSPGIEVIKKSSTDECGTKEDKATGPPDTRFRYCYNIKNTGNTCLYLALTEDGSVTVADGGEALELSVKEAMDALGLDEKCLPPGEELNIPSVDVEGPDFMCVDGTTFECSSGSQEETPVTVTGTDPDGNTVTDTDTAIVEITADPEVELVKTALNDPSESCTGITVVDLPHKAVGGVGTEFVYCYTITNTGNTCLNLAIADADSISTGDGSVLSGNLAAAMAALGLDGACLPSGDSVVFKGPSFTCDTGLGLPGSPRGCYDDNTEVTDATVTGTDPDGTAVTDQDGAGVVVLTQETKADDVCEDENMGTMGSDYASDCGHKGVNLLFSKPNNLKNLALLAGLDLEDIFFSLDPKGGTVQFRALNPFSKADHLEMYVQYEEPIVGDPLSVGQGRAPICIGDSQVDRCGQLDGGETMEAVCIGAGSAEPYALVNVYFVDTTGVLTIGGNAKVHECCEPDQAAWSSNTNPNASGPKVFHYSFSVSCNCPATESRRLRGHN